MKTISITFALVALCLNCYAQSRLNFTEAEIKKEFSASGYALKTDYTPKAGHFITVTFSSATVIHYLDEDRRCSTSVIIPDNQGALNYFVEQYNKQYVIISPTKWKMYSKNGISNVELVYPEEGGYIFIWTNNY